MLTVGIETSCDETSVAIVKDGTKILSNVVNSSLQFHKKYGGIVPEIASRKQLEMIAPAADLAIKEAKINLKDIDLISATSKPGLPGSLLVGLSFAKALNLSLDIPLLGVDHVHSHIYANFLMGNKIKLPVIALVVSGGHTSLFYLKDFDKIETLGKTQDDACGEAFDKVAKIMKLGYPGGPLIEELAKKGDNKSIKFNCSYAKSPLDFSFSGIKTAVLYAVRDKQLTLREKRNIAASFQGSVINTLVNKTLLACRMKKSKRLLIGGGVASNERLRESFYKAARGHGINCYFPAKNLCMDNAAMVAGLGYQLFKKGIRSNLDLFTQLN